MTDGDLDMTHGDRQGRKDVLALTMGEPSGIGPDITLMAWLHRGMGRHLPFVLLGQEEVLADRAKALGLDVPVARVASPGEALDAYENYLPVLALGEPAVVIAGQPSSACASIVIEAITRAVDLTVSGAAAAVVTNPIAKHVLYEAGFSHPGHTEYLEMLAHKRGLTARAVMMLTASDLRTVPLTIHIPLKDVAQRLSHDLIVEQVRVVAADLRRYFAIDNPRLAFCGLNPHAGENGTIGIEEQQIIQPAIETLRGEGFDAIGPLPADTMFHDEARRAYDVAFGMYHDQALIPVKMLGFHDGVNCTLGLPFIRTSPDHGTAFSLAGTGRANPSSLIAALALASQMVAHRS